MNITSAVERKLTRCPFAVRLAVFLLVGSCVLVAAKVGLALLSAKVVASHWPIYLFIMVGAIGALWLVAIAAFSAYFFVVRAVLPRLNDIGLYGPMRSWAAVLTFAYPVSILVLLCMLLTPSNYIPGAKSAL
jgi:hypothetical protein